MHTRNDRLAEMLTVERFPPSSEHNPEWVLTNQMGLSALRPTEWLCRRLGTADVLLDGCRLRLQPEGVRIKAGTHHFPSDEEAPAADGGEYPARFRAVARRKESTK